MENVREYKLISGKHSRRENGRRVRYRPGDVFVPIDAEIKKLRNRLEPTETKDETKDTVVETGKPAKTEDNTKRPVVQQSRETGEQHVIKHVGGGWYELPGGKRVQGKENAAKELAAMLEEQ